MRFQTWSDVLWLGTGADYAKANRFVVLDLELDDSSCDRLSHHQPVIGLATFDYSQDYGPLDALVLEQTVER
jgi:hypothetical protein